MPTYEYKVVPAPKKGLKSKGARTTEARFANALATFMNDLGREGWEYQQAETLPCEERSTLGSKSTSYQNVLVFRRLLQDDTISARQLKIEDKSDVFTKIDNAPTAPAPRTKLFSAKSDEGSAPEVEPVLDPIKLDKKLAPSETDKDD